MAGSKRDLGDALDRIVRGFFRREPKQRRSRALVEATVQAIDELIRRGEPIERVTVERVSQRAGIGMGTFYEYFADKDSVLGVLITKVTRSNFEELSRKLDAIEGDDLAAVIHAFSHSVVDTYLAHPNRTRVMLEGVGRLGMAQLVADEKDRFARVLALRAAELMPGEALEEIVATMRLVADAILGVLVFAAIRGEPIDRARIASDLSALALSILRSRHPNSDNRRGWHVSL